MSSICNCASKKTPGSSHFNLSRDKQNRSHSITVSALNLATQTFLIEALIAVSRVSSNRIMRSWATRIKRTHLPIRIRIIDRHLFASPDALRDEQNALRPTPIKMLKLRIRFARMVDEACEIPFFPLPDLVRRPIGLAKHDVQARDARCDPADELSYCAPSLQG